MNTLSVHARRMERVQEKALERNHSLLRRNKCSLHRLFSLNERVDANKKVSSLHTYMNFIGYFSFYWNVLQNTQKNEKKERKGNYIDLLHQ